MRHVAYAYWSTWQPVTGPMRHVADTPVSFLLVHVAQADHIRSPQITSDHRRSHQITADHIRSPQITSDHRRSHQITSDHRRSHQITADHRRSHQITADHIRSPLPIVWHRSAHFATCTIIWKKNYADVKAKTRTGHLIVLISKMSDRWKTVQPTALKSELFTGVRPEVSN